MPRRAGQLPELKRHKKTGHGCVFLDGRQNFLGPFDDADNRVKFDRLVARWLTKGRPKAGTPSARESPTVAMIAAFVVHADAYSRSSAAVPTGEAANVRDALRPVLRMGRATPATEFDQDCPDAVRAAMVRSGLARSTVDARAKRIRRSWGRAASKEMAPATTCMQLQMRAPPRSTGRPRRGSGGRRGSGAADPAAHPAARRRRSPRWWRSGPPPAAGSER